MKDVSGAEVVDAHRAKRGRPRPSAERTKPESGYPEWYFAKPAPISLRSSNRVAIR